VPKLPDYECDAEGCKNLFIVAGWHATLVDRYLRQYRICNECAARALKRED
jgi:hypothetical protein